MGKYTDIMADIFTVFNSTAWKAENIPTYPQDFPIGELSKFIRVSIIPSGKGINLLSVTGVCIIEIYTAYGNGPSEAFTIADTLDKYLVGKSLSLADGRVVQFDGSSVQPRGKDSANSALTRLDYTIPFKFFGVQ